MPTQRVFVVGSVGFPFSAFFGGYQKTESGLSKWTSVSEQADPKHDFSEPATLPRPPNHSGLVSHTVRKQNPSRTTLKPWEAVVSGYVGTISFQGVKGCAKWISSTE